VAAVARPAPLIRAQDAGLATANGNLLRCGVGQARCSNPLHPTGLNGASIAIAAMPGAATVARTVRSVSSSSQTYSASFSGPAPARLVRA
jgi:hypothetical protein